MNNINNIKRANFCLVGEMSSNVNYRFLWVLIQNAKEKKLRNNFKLTYAKQNYKRKQKADNSR